MAKELVLWLPGFGGKYGFVKWKGLYPFTLENLEPLTEEEELEQLKQQYEKSDHRLYPATPQISFKDYVRAWQEEAKRKRQVTRRKENCLTAT